MSPASCPPPIFPRRHQVSLVVAIVITSLSLVAKPAGGKAEVRELRREFGADAGGAKPSKRDDSAGTSGARSSISDAQSRVLAKLRERLNVPDDAEWEIIAERITRVDELRRNLWTGSSSSKGGPTISEKSKRSTKSAHPEQDALKSALNDKLPNAEIEVRLTRAREVYRQNEFKLARAQADLRAVLSVRQEAEAVVAGILPP